VRSEYKILVGKLERKRLLERFSDRWENNIRMDLKGNRVENCGLDVSGSGQGPMEGSCEHLNERPGSIKGGKFLDYLSDC
jgi:hypothetical protein